MANHRFRFAEEEEPRPPARVWVTRAVITSLIIGAAGVVHILYGFKLF